MTKDKDQKPNIEADPSPIIAPHLERVPGEIPRFVEREPVAKEPKLVREEDLIKEAIERAVNLQTDSAWAELILETPCFVRLWHDQELDEYCDLIDCDLRKLCQSTWEKVKGGLAADEVPPTASWSPSQKRKVGRPRTGRAVTLRSKWKGKGKYKRHQYVDQGRPVDRFAHTISELLGHPPELPDAWRYPVSKTKEQQEKAIQLFIQTFGPGAWVIRRTSYHQYLFEGQHLMRFWVGSGGGGGYLDLSRRVAKIISKIKGIDLEKSPVSGYKTKFRFYPFRMFIGRDRDIGPVKAALAKIENLVE